MGVLLLLLNNAYSSMIEAPKTLQEKEDVTLEVVNVGTKQHALTTITANARIPLEGGALVVPLSGMLSVPHDDLENKVSSMKGSRFPGFEKGVISHTYSDGDKKVTLDSKKNGFIYSCPRPETITSARASHGNFVRVVSVPYNASEKSIEKIIPKHKLSAPQPGNFYYVMLETNQKVEQQKEPARYTANKNNNLSPQSVEHTTGTKIEHLNKESAIPFESDETDASKRPLRYTMTPLSTYELTGYFGDQKIGNLKSSDVFTDKVGALSSLTLEKEGDSLIAHCEYAMDHNKDSKPVVLSGVLPSAINTKDHAVYGGGFKGESITELLKVDKKVTIKVTDSTVAGPLLISNSN